MKGIYERPEMIKAIVEKRKTVTRRVIKPQPIFETLPSSNGTTINSLGYFWKGHYIRHIENLIEYARYQVGETVYIKEAWYLLGVYQVNHISFDEKANIRYPLDNSVVWANKPRTKLTDVPLKNGNHSPMMMPEWAARYFITITDVRAERLGKITSGDCLAEGITASDKDGIGVRGIELDYKFGQLWNSLNKDYPWESNPFIFRYEFEYRGGLNE